MGKPWYDSSALAFCENIGPLLEEKNVRKSLERGFVQEGDAGMELLRESSWFMVPSKDWAGARFGGRPELYELPPLPFPRVLFEGTEDDLFGVYLAPSESGDTHRCPFFVVHEIEVGKHWVVQAFFVSRKGSRPPFVIVPYSITYTGGACEIANNDEIFGSDEVWIAAVTAAHIVTATNTTYSKAEFNRHQVREWRRKSWFTHEPAVYKVEIHEESHKHDTGQHSGRHYSVRWLVRGHYRKSPHGPYKHPVDNQPATWVRPHIKGPASAPWKGKPIYVPEPAR